MLIKVKVYPKAKEQKVEAGTADSVKIWVRARPERGEANREVIQLLSDYFQIPIDQIRLIHGSRKRSKIFEIPDNINLPEAESPQTQLFTPTDE